MDDGHRDGSRPPVQQLMGARIRGLREAAGLSQAELARRVYVSRQTVGNWEAGRTLADVQSLVLLAQVFETTVDDLLGEPVSRAIRATADDRHELARLLALSGALLAISVVSILARYLLAPLARETPAVEAARDVLALVCLACEAALALRALPRLRAFMRGHDLAGAVAAAAFLEGRDPAEEPPSDFLFRWFLPHWKLWFVALSAAALAAAALYASLLP